MPLKKLPPLLIHTERLTLRPFRAADRASLVRLLEGIDLRALFEGGGHNLTASRMAATLIRDAAKATTGSTVRRLSLAILPQGKRTLIGGALLDGDAEGGGDIGLWLALDYRDRGLGQEALSALIQYGFTVWGRTRITGICEPTNRASIRLMEACGMRFQHRLSSEDLPGGVGERRFYGETED